MCWIINKKNLKKSIKNKNNIMLCAWLETELG